jgi:DNA-binding transcriptional regulator PaaX
MKAKTQETLFCLLWLLESASRPSYRGMDSFEEWAHWRGYGPMLEDLEHRKYIESHRSKAARRIYKLSETGRIHAMGGLDLEAHWNRPWDRNWRMVIFDLPRFESSARKRLLRRLRADRFGLLQNSVWIHPDPVDTDLTKLSGRGDDVATILIMNAHPAAGEATHQIVGQAWNFEKTNDQYRKHIHSLQTWWKEIIDIPREDAKPEVYLVEERKSWIRSVQSDPLLPNELNPRDYIGKKALEKRRQFLAKFMAHFAAPPS